MTATGSEATTEREADAWGLAALVESAAWLDPLGRALVIARGADRVRFLNGVVTAEIAHLAVGQGTRALLLTPKAQIVADFYVFLRADDAYLLVPAGQGAAAAAALARYAVMDDFTAEPAAEVEALGVLGPRSGTILSALGISVAELQTAPLWAHATIGPWFVARARQLGADGFWLVGSRSEAEALRVGLIENGIPRLSPAAAEAARIVAAEPGWGQEITEDVFPMEIGLNDAIAYSKGCFLGQEPIVRIRDRGHVNWRLAALDIAPGPMPVPGDKLESDARPKAGTITSAAVLPDGKPVALALVHVSLPSGTPVRITSAAGATSSPQTAVIR